MIGNIIAMRKHHASRPPEMRVNISIPAQIMEVEQSIKGDNDDPATREEIRCWVEQDLPSCVRAWLPLAMLVHVMPDQVEEFQNRHPVTAAEHAPHPQVKVTGGNNFIDITHAGTASGSSGEFPRVFIHLKKNTDNSVQSAIMRSLTSHPCPLRPRQVLKLLT
jgi:hypothetical protein